MGPSQLWLDNGHIASAIFFAATSPAELTKFITKEPSLAEAVDKFGMYGVPLGAFIKLTLQRGCKWFS